MAGRGNWLNLKFEKYILVVFLFCFFVLFLFCQLDKRLCEENSTIKTLGKQACGALF